MAINSLVAKSTVVAALGGLLFGFDMAVISGTTQQLSTQYHLSPALLGVTVSSALIGTVIAALTASGVEVIDLDIVTTPGVAMMVKHLQADAGIVATASHNPIQWNGLKFLSREAVALIAPQLARRLTSIDERKA